MTKKDYELIARVIREQREKYHHMDENTVVYDYLVEALVTALESENERFDGKRFKEAAGNH